MNRTIWLGYDSREVEAFAVARHSIRRRLSESIPVRGLMLPDLIARGLYSRPTGLTIDGNGNRRLIDVLSITADYDGSMATEFAISRFLTKYLAGVGWALFMDCDMLVRADLVELFAQADETKALMCVQHGAQVGASTKMDGQRQVAYSRKNWSSVMLLNCDHPANERLTVEMVNTVPGRDLHRFCWLEDAEIGALDPTWNWLAGLGEPMDDPKVVHHTLGSPCLPGYDGAPFADEWRAELVNWAGA